MEKNWCKKSKNFGVKKFCTPETPHFQQNNSLSFFSPQNLEIDNAEVVGLLELIRITYLITYLISLKSLYIFGPPILIADFEIFWLKK